MKKLAFLVPVLLVFLLSAPGVQAYSYPVSQDQFVYFTDLGGTTNGGPFGVWDYDNKTLLFATFCVETDEFLTPGYNSSVKYKVAAISTSADEGGAGASPTPDPLDPRSAWIYDTWVHGNTYGWDVDDVQKALWYIEDEPSGDNNAVVTAAAGQWSDIGPVSVLNMEKWQKNAIGAWGFVEKSQDVLVTVAEPATMLLLGFGLLGLTVLGRKRFVK